MQGKQRQTGEGWYMNPLWAWLDVPVRYGLVSDWDDLSVEWKAVLLAKARRDDTMQQWELAKDR